MLRPVLLAAICFASSCFGQVPRTVRFADVESILAHDDETIHVINFWATWCGPCIKELPYFESLTKRALPQVKVTLISMDLDLDPDAKKVYRFVERKKLQSEVLLLDERDPNTYIGKVDPGWSGALPATLIVNHKTGARRFIERGLKEGELEQLLDDIQ